MRKRPRRNYRNYTLEYHFLLYRYFCETLYQHLHAFLIKTQHSKHAYCQKITRSLSYVLLATRKSVSPYQLSLQRFDKCLAEIVANWSQVGFKLVASWTQELTQDYRKAMFPTTEEKVARTGTQCPPPGGFFYLVLISHNEES